MTENVISSRPADRSWKSPRPMTRRVAALRLQEGWEVVSYLGIPKLFIRSPAGAVPRLVVELPRPLALLLEAPEAVPQFTAKQEAAFVAACNKPGAFFVEDMAFGNKKPAAYRRSDFERAWED